ncbi:putative tRNA pseudouridine synthase D [Rosellinia necatrix]|uniref:Putative tRNA pseudouridine synthase D n=1 Tax=Rosellinia necatrix TaxID=77044 RepID=A0A1W2TMN1_ROSNE|nr:putative tRNA pseudouridine synthase D [Rosellinia necatrix]
MAQGNNASMRSSLEQRLGILHFVSTKKHGWSGQSRARFTDFQVNEITKDGEVVHLNDFYNNTRDQARAASQGNIMPVGTPKLDEPDEPVHTTSKDDTVANISEHTEDMPGASVDEPPTDNITESDKNALVDLVGQPSADELISLYSKIQQKSKTTSNTHGNICIPAIGDKSQRSLVHGEIRRIFGGKVDTTTASDGSIKATAVRGGSKQRGNRSINLRAQNNRQDPSQGSGGPYLHFSLYKENKDTMDALNHMAKALRIHPKAFGAAGTKDRRAVTVQRVSIKGRNPNSLIVLNERIGNVKIGDFKYEQHPIRLNDHDGNEFVIVLKNCVFSDTENLNFEEKLNVAKSIMDSALSQVIQRGFINYYGTQRFGTHRIGTQEIGMKILKEDFSGAIEALLSYDPLLLQESQDQDHAKGAHREDHAKGAHREDINRARACSAFLETKNPRAALEYLPPRCHVEKAIIQHLGKNPTDFVGALMSINRSMRTMYGHAYQSLVWNFVASKRWDRFGAEVINGDLVLVKSRSAATDGDQREAEASQVWEDDIAASQNYGFVAHAVTEDDLLDEKYSIYDVVLPTPGWDVIYPPNEIGDFYAEFMSEPKNGGLDPYNMRRRQRDFSLPGSYRKLMGKLKRVPTASVQAYSNDLEQLVPTDLDIIRARRAKEQAGYDARHEIAVASWHAFAQNAHLDKFKESKTGVTQREVEDLTPSTRINDMWVQTSVDGSNKRIKIATHTNTDIDEPRSISTHDENSMQVDGSRQNGKPAEIGLDVAAVYGQDGLDSLQGQQLDSKKAPTHQEIRSTTGRTSPQPVSTGGETITAVDVKNDLITQRMPTPELPHLVPDAGSDQVSIRAQLSNDSQQSQSGISPLAPTSIVATDKVEPTKTTTAVPAISSNPTKIAVILRFALDTSQYATIVIRELQGAPATNDNSA